MALFELAAFARGRGAPGVTLSAYFLFPGVIGSQELTALIARTPAVAELGHFGVIASPFGTIHAANFTMPRPISAAMPASLGYALAGLDSTNADITGSIRERILGDMMVELSQGLPAVPKMERRLKGDRLVATPAEPDVVAMEPEWGRKGDRFMARSQPRPEQPEQRPEQP